MHKDPTLIKSAVLTVDVLTPSLKIPFIFSTSRYWFCENAADHYRCILNVTPFVHYLFRFVVVFGSLCFTRHFSYCTFFAIIVTNICWIYDAIISIKIDLYQVARYICVTSKCILYYYPARLSAISLQIISALSQSHLLSLLSYSSENNFFLLFLFITFLRFSLSLFFFSFSLISERCLFFTFLFVSL